MLERGVAGRARGRGAARATWRSSSPNAAAGWRVIDGLGHGDEAADAAERSPRGDPRARRGRAAATLLAACHEALLTTRGVVMTAAWFDLERSSCRGPASATSRRGSCARPRGSARTSRSSSAACSATGCRDPAGPRCRSSAATLVLITDGIDAAISPSLAARAPRSALAERILERHGRAPTTRWPSSSATGTADGKSGFAPLLARNWPAGHPPNGFTAYNQRAHATSLNHPPAHLAVPGGRRDRRSEYASDLSLDDIARRVASSRRQLQRAYAEIGQTTFRDHLTGVRMQKAAEMLATPRR